MLRLPKMLVLLGFTLAGCAGLTQFGVWIPPAGQIFEVIATTLGFTVLGFASWAWLRTLERRPGSAEIRLPLRLFALGCLVLGVAYLGEVRTLYEMHGQEFHPGLRYFTLNVGASVIGFGMAAVGFWLASMKMKSPATATDDDGDAPSTIDEEAVATSGSV
jgi:hypothetical protein